jgi:hypothetical protein
MAFIRIAGVMKDIHRIIMKNCILKHSPQIYRINMNSHFVKYVSSVSLQVFTVIVLIFLAECGSGSGDDSVKVLINEFMTSNTADNPYPATDEYGQTDDWIELYNPADTSISISGLFITDDSTDLQKSSLPDTIIPSHGYFVLWADGEPEQGPHHLDFKLSATNGEEIIITSAGGTIIDRINFANDSNPQARLTDRSFGRSPDGGEEWCLMVKSSPGIENSECGE